MIRRMLNRLFPESTERVEICSIVNFCTHDYRFLKPCLREAGKFSSQILVACSDHFFDGKPENQELLKKAKEENPEVEFVLLPFETGTGENQQYWVTLSRWNALSHVQENIKYILFLDADEIVEGEKFASF